jgi:hypothetical protein
VTELFSTSTFILQENPELFQDVLSYSATLLSHPELADITTSLVSSDMLSEMGFDPSAISGATSLAKMVTDS